MLSREKMGLLNKFDNGLNNLVYDIFIQGDVQPKEINEYYKYGDNCQIAKKLIQLIEHWESLERGRNETQKKP